MERDEVGLRRVFGHERRNCFPGSRARGRRSKVSEALTREERS